MLVVKLSTFEQREDDGAWVKWEEKGPIEITASYVDSFVQRAECIVKIVHPENSAAPPRPYPMIAAE
jgi:hypothetical protein